MGGYVDEGNEHDDGGKVEDYVDHEGEGWGGEGPIGIVVIDYDGFAVNLLEDVADYGEDDEEEEG